MKNKKILALLAFVVLIGLLSAAGAQHSGSRIGYRETIVVSADESRENIFACGADIRVEGEVRKTVFNCGGTIVVSGEVGESVVGIGSGVTLKSAAVIRGDLVVLGGTIEKEPGFRIDGDTVYISGSDITSKLFREGARGIFAFSFWPIIVIFKLVKIFIWFLLALLVASLFPKQVVFASDQIRKSFWPTFATGLVAFILFIFAVIISAVLCLLLIGIPILVALAMAGFVIKVFGRVVVFYLIGESLARSLHRERVSALGGAFLGLLVLAIIGFVPVLGFLITSFLGALGWGVAIRTKFGTKQNWFSRPERPPCPPSTPAPPAPPTVPPPVPPTS
jgi:hypothetical protein